MGGGRWKVGQSTNNIRQTTNTYNYIVSLFNQFSPPINDQSIQFVYCSMFHLLCGGVVGEIRGGVEGGRKGRVRGERWGK